MAGDPIPTAAGAAIHAPSPPPSPILRAAHLTRTTGETAVVDDVSLELARGETLALVGRSGAGKSSLLRLLNRLDEPTGGTVFLEGRDYREIPPRELRRRVAMVMQAPFLFPGTAADNLRFGPRQRGADFPAETIRHLLERVGLPGYEQRDVARLSGGEAQRVSLARTLANNPEVLLLDEPTSALDPATERDVEELIRGIVRDGGLTCVIVTHDREQALRMAGRAMLMQSGRRVALGSTEEVLGA